VRPRRQMMPRLEPRTQTRPIWKRVASRLKNTSYRFVTIADRIAHWRSDALLPPAHLRAYYYRTWKPEAFVRACEVVRTELISHGLRPEHRILDIGSGIGNLAIGLIGYSRGSYEGVEIHREAVAWCQRAITPGHPAFHFHHADIRNDAYNPRGRTVAATYRFPFPDQDFDFIFLGSVFTHLLPDAVEQYLHEISRLLRPGGICVASYFLLNDESRTGVRAGRSFMSFPFDHASGLCLLHDSTKVEAAVALDETFVRQLYERTHLRIRDMRRGRWWSGLSDDQDVVTAVRDSP
jgi:SAM-dependent methyltransferase